jgi:hypothetical protein
MLSVILALVLIVGMGAPASAASANMAGKSIAQKEQVWGCYWTWITDYSLSDGGYWFWKCNRY